MKTLAYTVDLIDNPSIIESYKKYHKNIYPEVIDAGKGKGIITQKIFIFGNRLFMVMDVEDYYDPNSQGDYLVCDRCKEWDNLMRSYQIPAKGAKQNERWVLMDLVYDKKWFD